MDVKFGDVIFPLTTLPDGLPLEPGSVDEIRASHVLEHFPHRQIENVLRDWVDTLRPGGVLKIAVPDFERIARLYLAGEKLPIEGFVVGGQTDEHDYHQALFDMEHLKDLLRRVGLIGIRRWQSETQDCASLPISLNLCGTKPHAKLPKISAVISMPRLGFNDFWACAYRELAACGIELKKVTGAYWDRDLTKVIEEALAQDSPEWILTLDYDTVFTRHQVLTLIDVAMRYPHADAVAPLQTARHHDAPMFTTRDTKGNLVEKIDQNVLAESEVIRCETAHFGLTLLRADKLLSLPKPWFLRRFSPDGNSAGDGAMDPDVAFWHGWKDAGNSLYVALRVPVGHTVLRVKWPGPDLSAVYQDPSEFWATGIPDDIWR